MYRFSTVLVLCGFLMACSGGSGGGSTGGGQPAPVQPTSDPRCGIISLKSNGLANYSLKYCFVRSSFTPKNIVYFFHGVNGDASDVFQIFSKNSPYFQVFGNSLTVDKIPTVIAISFGPVGVFPPEIGVDPKGSASMMALLTTGFHQIETQLGFQVDNPEYKPNRHLMGISMGGFNVISMAANFAQNFKSEIALCPALITFDPFNDIEIQQYILRNSPSVHPDMVQFLVTQLRQKFITKENWNLENPFVQLRNNRFTDANLFLSTGATDEFGFLEGGKAFEAQAKEHNVHSVFAPTEGGHCSADFGALSQFIQQNY
jgi:hypothetical protein